MNWKRLALLFIFLVHFSLVACDSKSGKPVIGREAPNFSYYDLEGKGWDFNKHKGKVVILRFWADWCPHCAVEMPIIEKVYQEMKDRGLVVIAVNVKQPKEKVRAFVSQFNISYSIALDQDGKISEKYAVRGLPVNYVINSQGVLKEMILGAITDAAMLKEFLAPYF